MNRQSDVPEGIRWIGLVYLSVQAVALVGYWAWLSAVPEARGLFRVRGSTDGSLMAFWLGDLTIYGGTSVLAAWGIWRRKRWVHGLLCVHAGAAVYAAMYAIAVLWWDPGRWLGALMMAPALIVPPALAWLTRAQGRVQG